MKQRIIILIFGIFIFVVLTGMSLLPKSGEPVTYYKEKQFSFSSIRCFNWENKVFQGNRNCLSNNQWIRQPQNILMVHETLKKIGYHNVIPEHEWDDDPSLRFGFINKSLRNIVDSLYLTYNMDEKPLYYDEFWKRRSVEGNDSVVYQVISEIHTILSGNTLKAVNESRVNDTLYTLLSLEYPRRTLTDSMGNEHLEYLIEIGLHQSAFYLISNERYQYFDVKWNQRKKKVIERLETDSVYIAPWFADNTK